MDAISEPRGAGGGSMRRRIAVALAAVAVGAAGLGAYLGIQGHRPGGGSAHTAAALAPPAVTEPVIAYDAATKDVVMFGGFGSGAPATGTWLWDGQSWRQAATPASPPPGEAAMAYDPASHDMVLVTLGSTSPMDHPQGLGLPAATTWLWDGRAWFRSPAPAVPASVAQLATDVVAGDVIMDTGSVPLAEPAIACAPPAEPADVTCQRPVPLQPTTYRWTGTHWADTGSALPARTFTGDERIVTDPVSGRPVSVSAQAPVLECATPGTVVPQPAPLTGAPGGTPAATPGRPLLTPPAAVGSPMPIPLPGVASSPGPMPVPPCRATPNPTGGTTAISRWDGSRWSASETVTGSVLGEIAASQHGIVDIDAEGHTVWQLAGMRWTTLASLPADIGLTPAVADDPAAGQLLAFGGIVTTHDGRPAISTMTWTWDGSGWTQHGGTLVTLPEPSVVASPPVASGSGSAASPPHTVGAVPGATGGGA